MSIENIVASISGKHDSGLKLIDESKWKARGEHLKGFAGFYIVVPCRSFEDNQGEATYMCACACVCVCFPCQNTSFQ